MREIVNDEIAGMPLTITFCPLCNTGIVFHREVDGVVLDFGTTGKLRKSDLVSTTVKPKAGGSGSPARQSSAP